MAVKTIEKPKAKKIKPSSSRKIRIPPRDYDNLGPNLHKRVKLVEERKSAKRTIKANPKKFPPEPPIDDD